MKDEISGKIKIIDIKTSSRAWNKYQKANEVKNDQLLLYKEYYSKKGYSEKNTFMYRDFYYYAKILQIIEVIFTIMVLMYLCT